MILCLLSVLGVVRTFQKSKCKKLLETTLERIQILRCKREVQLQHLRGDAAQLMKRGKNQKAQIWLEHLWKELCLLSVYIKIQEYCNKVRINLSNIAGQRECPMDLEEPVAGLCFVASCCADLPELQELREIFASKYGAEFVNFAQELKDTSHVNRSILDFLSTKGPPENFKEELKEYVLTQSDMKDRIQKELLSLLSKSSSKANEVNEGKLVTTPKLELEAYESTHELIDAEPFEANDMALVLDEELNMSASDYNANARLYDMNSSYGRHSCTYGSRSKMRGIHPRSQKWKMKADEYEAALNTNHGQLYMKHYRDIRGGHGQYGDQHGNDDDHESDRWGEVTHTSDDGYFLGDNETKYLAYQCQSRHSDDYSTTPRASCNAQHLQEYSDEYSTMARAYNIGNYHTNSSGSSPSLSSMPPCRKPPPLPCAPSRSPPPFPRVSSMPLLDKTIPENEKKNRIPRSASTTFDDFHTKKPWSIPPDYEHVVARVAELSSRRTLQKESSF